MISRTLIALCWLPLFVSGELMAAETPRADLATALDLAGPALTAAAHTWPADALLAEFANSDPEQRHGAARLASQAGLPPATLLAALIASPDTEVRRLGAAGLRAGVADLPASDLLRLSAPEVVLPLLHAHPTALTQEDVRNQVRSWLAQPASTALAASLIAARGDLATWGEPLVGLLADAKTPPDVVIAAHRTLERLSTTQRSLDAYAGDRALLVRDWRDLLAARAHPAPGPVAAELAALVADLPRSEALAGLLAYPQRNAALAAVEHGLEGVPRARRVELARAARLLAREVSPVLFAQLGESGFDGLDAEDPAVRLATFRRCAEVVHAKYDAPGLLHLVTWLDDTNAGVRVAALNQLVRLSDDAEKFGSSWRLKDQDLFPPQKVAWRLRRCLERGARDERLAALLVIGCLQGEEFRADAAALLLAADGDVIDGAIDLLGVILPTTTEMPALLRLGSDTAQPAVRRRRALEVLGRTSHSRRGEGKADAQAEAQGKVIRERALMTLEELTGDPEPLVSKTASTALGKLGDGDTQRVARVSRLLAKGAIPAAVAVAGEDPAAAALLAPLLNSSDPVIVVAAGSAIIRALREDSDFPMPQRDIIRRRLDLVHSGQRLPVHEALALELGDARQPQAIAALAQADAAARTQLWSSLVHTCPRRSADLMALAAVVAHPPAGWTPDAHEVEPLIDRIVATAALESGRLSQVLNTQSTGVLDAHGTSFSNFGKNQQVTIDLGMDGELVAVEHLAPGKGVLKDNSTATWEVTTKPTVGLSVEADMPALAAALAGLPAEGRLAEYRTLAVAYLGGPAPSVFQGFDRYDELWQLLLLRQPALRPQVAAAINSSPTLLRSWTLRKFLEPGNPDLLPMVLRLLADDSDGELLTWLTALPPAALRPHLAELAAVPKLVGRREILQLLREAAPLPLAVALPLLPGNRLALLGPTPVAPYADDAADSVAKALQALDPAQIIEAAPALRLLRSAGSATFDAALAPLAAADDARGAAWLRTGLPLQAGQTHVYVAALTSTVPERRLAGAALAVKESRLSSDGFIALVVDLPPALWPDAAVIAQRYLAADLPTRGVPLSNLLRRAPSAGLSAWLPLVPPVPPVEAALADRLADPATADSLGPLLAERLRVDAEHWGPVVQRLQVAAKGRLDWLRVPSGK